MTYYRVNAAGYEEIKDGDEILGVCYSGEENARLWTAAPELLAAAEGIEDCEECWEVGAGYCDEHKAMRRAAIAKAKGEQ